MNMPVKVSIKTDTNKITKLSINDEPFDAISTLYQFELRQEAGELPVLHLWIPVFEAAIEIEKCEVEEHEINSSV